MLCSPYCTCCMFTVNFHPVPPGHTTSHTSFTGRVSVPMLAMLRPVLRVASTLHRTIQAPLVPTQSGFGAPTFASAIGALRHKMAGRRNAVWWQPLLPALAPQLVPNTPGKGNRKRKMQQRRAQSVTNHARRKEGERRAMIFTRLKEEKHTDQVRAVYQEYAERLRASAMKSPDGDGQNK